MKQVDNKNLKCYIIETQEIYGNRYSRNYMANNEYEDKEANRQNQIKMKEFLAKGGKIERVPLSAESRRLRYETHWTDAELKAKWRQENGIKEEPGKKRGRT